MQILCILRICVKLDDFWMWRVIDDGSFALSFYDETHISDLRISLIQKFEFS